MRVMTIIITMIIIIRIRMAVRLRSRTVVLNQKMFECCKSAVWWAMGCSGRTERQRGRISSRDDYQAAEEDVVLGGTPRKLLPFLSHPFSFWIYFINSLPLFSINASCNASSMRPELTTKCIPVIPVCRQKHTRDWRFRGTGIDCEGSADERRERAQSLSRS